MALLKLVPPYSAILQRTMSKNFFRLALLAITTATASQLFAQVQTDIPAAVPGAKAVTVERIKIHGRALEGNLEKNAVDRDVFDSA